jgi:hypothetical protein
MVFFYTIDFKQMIYVNCRLYVCDGLVYLVFLMLSVYEDSNQLAVFEIRIES